MSPPATPTLNVGPHYGSLGGLVAALLRLCVEGGRAGEFEGAEGDVCRAAPPLGGQP